LANRLAYAELKEATLQNNKADLAVAHILLLQFLYGAGHIVGRVLSFSPVVGIGTSPTPRPQATMPPPPLVPGGGAHSLAREGGGRVPIPTRGHRLWYSVNISTLWRRVNKKLDEDPSTSHDFVTLVGLVSYYGAD
jgi:hypothetical protein